MMPTHTANLTTTGNRPDASARTIGVQKVVVVNSSPEILTIAERVLAAGRYNVVFVESMAHAYSQIRRVQPHLVILCLTLGDLDAFQLLSMLKLDPDTRTIPVLTYTAEDPLPGTDQDVSENSDDTSVQEFLSQRAAALMN